MSAARVLLRTAGAVSLLVGVGLVIGLAFPGFVARTVVPTFLYVPRSLPADRSAPADHGVPTGEELRIRTADGVALHAWWVPPADRPCGVVLYFHGNAGTIAGRAPVAARIAAAGHAALMVDYRGYGLSEGSPSEEGLREDARAAWRHLLEERGVEPERVVVAGHSLGAAVAAGLARETSPAGAVLSGVFTSVPELAEHLYPLLPDALFRGWPTERWEVLEAAAAIDAPVLVGRGGLDDLVPRAQSRRVYEAAGPGAEWHEAGTAGHGDLWFDEGWWERLGPFLDRTLGCR